MTADVVALMRELSDIGRDEARGGYSRHLFDPADLRMREWFEATARGLGLQVERDRNANLWATWAVPHDATRTDDADTAVVTGSHLDSVPGGGAFDGCLGIASAFDAVARLRASGFTPRRPIRVVAFAEEEGSRFGYACLGSHLLTGTADVAALLESTDDAGVRLADLLERNGLDPHLAGHDPARLQSIGVFVELHVEQGRQLEPLNAQIGVATSILAHGRWTITIAGRGDHAGATELDSRHDPVLVAATVIQAARACAMDAPPEHHARATVGRVKITPGGTNAIASEAKVWLDARAEHDDDVNALVESIRARATTAADAEGCRIDVRRESYTSRVQFDTDLADRLDGILGGVPHIPTGAGHDAGILAAAVPTAMIFVRNLDGVSHSPHETATDDDMRAGVDALTAVLRELA